MSPLRQTTESSAEKPANRRVGYPDLGHLSRGFDGCWSTKVLTSCGPVVVRVMGDDRGPDPLAALEAAKSVRRLDALRDEAVEFILSDLAPSVPLRIDPAGFAVTALCHLCAEHPEEFWVELRLDGDPDAIWRVDFGLKRALVQGTG
jgi:hypothetical protein